MLAEKLKSKIFCNKFFRSLKTIFPYVILFSKDSVDFMFLTLMQGLD